MSSSTTAAGASASKSTCACCVPAVSTSSDMTTTTANIMESQETNFDSKNNESKSVDAKPDEPEPCEDDCCSEEVAVVTNKSSGLENVATCCDENEMDCCGSEEKDDCASAKQPVPASNVKECCDANEENCCDDACIDRIAVRECGRSCGTSESKKRTISLKPPVQCPSNYSTAESSSAARVREKTDNITDESRSTPCSYHSQSTRQRYQPLLEAVGCLCRVLLANNQQSCCSSTKSSLRRRRVAKSGSVSSFSSSIKQKLSAQATTTARDCCSQGADVCCEKEKEKDVKVKEASCGDSCCDEPPAKKSTVSVECADLCCKKEKVGCGDSCCSKPVARPTAPATGCKDACCDTEEELIISPVRADDVDLEKGLSGTEHIVLAISGMTCTGCETKLQRVLGTVPSIRNPKTSLVLSRVEFDLDLGAGSLAEVVRHIERTTDFSCEKINTTGSQIDVLRNRMVAEPSKLPLPAGVTSLEDVDSTTVRLVFDAHLIGARDLANGGFGSPLQLAPIRPDPALAAGRKHVRYVGYMTILAAVLTIPVLVMAWAPLPEREVTYGAVSLSLATILQVVVAGPFYPKAIKSLIFSRLVEMDLLIVLSTSAAYIFSVVAFGYLVSGQPLSTGEFFETSTLLVTLIMVGRYVSALARQKAVESVSVRSLQTPTAVLVASDSEAETEIDARLLQYGDVFKVAPESRVPTDGTVISGSSEIDESMITGESMPVEKQIGSSVIAGSVNGSGALLVRLTRLPNENTISTIAGMVDEAKLSKPRIEQTADRVASYFVPVIVVLTLITFAIWVGIGMGPQGRSGSEAAIQAITYAIAVLIISCPCAIGLAVPMVIVIASGVAAERGLIVKSAATFEIAHKTSHVVFDKTGTLTQGRLSVVEEEYPSENQAEVQSLLLGMLADIKHPVSVAIAHHLIAQGVVPTAAQDVKSLPGRGVEATSGKFAIRVGNTRWLALDSHPLIRATLARGHTTVCATIDSNLSAIFTLTDTLRPDAASTVSALQSRGIAISLISGDDAAAVRSVASALGIPDTNVRAQCSPADKQNFVRDLTTNNTTVIFCGDGTNDAVALAQASIGVHMNEGTDVAKSAADVVLVRPSLGGIVTLLDLSKASMRRITFNFGWSFVYNLFAVLLAAGAFVTARIPPQYAGLGELVSVLPVILVALQLKWAKIGKA